MLNYEERVLQTDNTKNNCGSGNVSRSVFKDLATDTRTIRCLSL